MGRCLASSRGRPRGRAERRRARAPSLRASGAAQANADLALLEAVDAAQVGSDPGIVGWRDARERQLRVAREHEDVARRRPRSVGGRSRTQAALLDEAVGALALD